MSYRHILVAVDLTENSQMLINKAVKVAKAVDAKVSFIHIDVNHADLYSGLIDVNLGNAQEKIDSLSHNKLNALASDCGYPIEHRLVAHGEFSVEIADAIVEKGFDLLVCGHHQDFWSHIMSSTKQLINSIPIDMLVVPIKD